MRLLALHIENFRGIQMLDLEFGDVTVLIGENNAGKTSVLDALKICLRDLRSRQGSVFDPYDFYLASANSEPRDAPPIKIVLKFGELTAGEWSEAITGPLARVRILQITAATGLSQVTLQVTASFGTSGEPEHDFVGSPGRSVGGLMQNAAEGYGLVEPGRPAHRRCATPAWAWLHRVHSPCYCCQIW